LRGSVWSSEPVGFVDRARLDLAEILPRIFLAAAVVARFTVGVSKVANRKKNGLRNFEYGLFIPQKTRRVE
jgi:hypothetical protein